MKFVRLATPAPIFAAETDEGALYALSTLPGGPADYLQLHAAAMAAGLTPTAYAARLLPASAPLPWRLAELDVTPDPARPHLLMPYVPPEVWGAAFTYPARPGLNDPYADVRHAGRPVVFFKATPPRCVGPNDAVGSRADTTAMIPEPELGVILNGQGGIIGYTVVNDVSSRDLPQQHPLYMCYSKTFDRCVSLGPAIAPPEAIPNPLALSVQCRVERAGQVLWDETGTTGTMTRTLDDLVTYTVAHNQVPPGTLLATGSAMSPPRGMHLVEGDVVEVTIPTIGRLCNSVVTI